MLLLFKLNGGWKLFFDFLEKITSFVCLLESGLICIFYWKAHFLIFSWPEFNSFADISISWTFEKREVSSAKILNIDVISSGTHLWKSKIKEALILTHVVPQNLFFSTQIFNHIRLLFVHDYEGNPQVRQVIHLQPHMHATWMKNHYSRL